MFGYHSSTALERGAEAFLLLEKIIQQFGTFVLLCRPSNGLYSQLHEGDVPLSKFGCPIHGADIEEFQLATAKPASPVGMVTPLQLQLLSTFVEFDRAN